MVAELARGDYEDLIADGLKPTLDDFDRLNQLALRLEDGPETTPANHPRIGWAGDVPFHQPTFAATAWYLTYAEHVDCDDETRNTLWWFALAHARQPGVFAALVTPEAIKDAVGKWADGLSVTRDEVLRAARFAACGYDDAVAGKTPLEETAADPKSDAESIVSGLYRKFAEFVGTTGVPPSEAAGLTVTEMNAVLAAAYDRLGRSLSVDEARLNKEYWATYREIYNRLKTEAADV